MFKYKLNNAGFSLIELMVVVAIIGVLAAIGIPYYAAFQAKARTVEAKAALESIYVGEHTFYAEWNQYSTDLLQVGATVMGSDLRYTAGFRSTPCGTQAPAPLEAAADANSQMHLTSVTPLGGTWVPVIITNGTTLHAMAGSACVVNSAFTAVAIGDPRAAPVVISASSDTWTINEKKQLANTVVGL